MLSWFRQVISIEAHGLWYFLFDVIFELLPGKQGCCGSLAQPREPSPGKHSQALSWESLAELETLPRIAILACFIATRKHEPV